MRIAVISDIHGNITALEAVIASIDRAGIDQLVCLGDLVGYGARPNECVELIKDRGIPTIMGNHDKAAVRQEDLMFFNDNARQSIRWTRNILKRDNIEHITTLQMSLIMSDTLFVHSTPDNPGAWRYLLSNSDTHQSFKAFSKSVCFIGHTHISVVFRDRTSNRRLINTGSVGQPRDHDPRACWVLHDTSTGEHKLERVEYDINATVQQIKDANLPSYLAERLVLGV